MHSIDYENLYYFGDLLVYPKLEHVYFNHRNNHVMPLTNSQCHRLPRFNAWVASKWMGPHTFSEIYNQVREIILQVIFSRHLVIMVHQSQALTLNILYLIRLGAAFLSKISIALLIVVCIIFVFFTRARIAHKSHKYGEHHLEGSSELVSGTLHITHQLGTITDSFPALGHQLDKSGLQLVDSRLSIVVLGQLKTYILFELV
jgi:hypothetical protein